MSAVAEMNPTAAEAAERAREEVARMLRSDEAHRARKESHRLFMERTFGGARRKRPPVPKGTAPGYPDWFADWLHDENEGNALGTLLDFEPLPEVGPDRYITGHSVTCCPRRPMDPGLFDHAKWWIDAEPLFEPPPRLEDLWSEEPSESELAELRAAGLDAPTDAAEEATSAVESRALPRRAPDTEEVLAVLRDWGEPLSIAELMVLLETSDGIVRGRLNALAAAGLVKYERVKQGGRGRPLLRYTPS